MMYDSLLLTYQSSGIRVTFPVQEKLSRLDIPTMPRNVQWRKVILQAMKEFTVSLKSANELNLYILERYFEFCIHTYRYLDVKYFNI